MRHLTRRESPLAILTVCTGNICRSPLAEQIFRIRLAGNPHFEIGSAGLHAVVGSPMDKEAAIQLRAHGGDPKGLRGEQLSGSQVSAADLILTMTRGQRDEVIRQYPTAMQRTFSLAEFAALLRTEPTSYGTLRERIAHSARTRTRVQLTETDDIRDPIDANVKVHESVGNQIVMLIEQIVPLLIGTARLSQ